MAVEGYDLVMLGILAAAAVLGYFKGIVWQIAWIAGIALSSYVALRFGTAVAPFCGQQAPWNRLIAMLALYVGASLAVWLVFRVISGAISAIHLSAFDHQLGLLLGLAKGVLLCVVVTFFSVTLAPGYRSQIMASRSGQIVAQLIVRADEYLPRDVAATVEPFVRHFEEQVLPGSGRPQPLGGISTSPFQAIWEGVTSAAAWMGPEQGGGQAQQAGGVATGSPQAAWSLPFAGAHPPTEARPPAAGFMTPPSPPPPVQRPAYPMPAPPQQFPIGAQTPLPIR